MDYDTRDDTESIIKTYQRETEDLKLDFVRTPTNLIQGGDLIERYVSLRERISKVQSSGNPCQGYMDREYQESRGNLLSQLKLLHSETHAEISRRMLPRTSRS